MLRENGVELNCSDSVKVIQCTAVLFLLANEVVFMVDQKKNLILPDLQKLFMLASHNNVLCLLFTLHMLSI